MTEMEDPLNYQLTLNGSLAEDLDSPTTKELNKLCECRKPAASKQSVLELATNKNKPTISILGLGYVGAVSSACFSELGFPVIGVDPDMEKVDCINRGSSPIVEKDLSELLFTGREQNKLEATNDTIAAVLNSDVTLISVGTPSAEDGGCDLKYLRQACQQLGEALRMKSDYHLIVVRSTIPPSTTRNVLVPIIEQYSGKLAGDGFGVCFNPEFLRESTAVEDFYHPPITVLGAIDKRSLEYSTRLYQDIHAEVIGTSLEAAEFVKYVDNTWHALKVTFGNEVGRLCKAANVDSHDVMNIFLKDTKLNISPYYLKPGFAYGGSCLAKDARGITHLAKSLNVDLPVISKIEESNNSHISHAVEIVEEFCVSNVGLVGITFKAGTDDLRESPAIELMKRLLNKGYRVKFFDPCITSSTKLDRDPEWNDKLQECFLEFKEELLLQSEVLIVTHSQEYAVEITEKATADMHVLDVVRLPEGLNCKANYQGIGW
jgi:GDP-mannose 6-dehydrogenase